MTALLLYISYLTTDCWSLPLSLWHFDSLEERVLQGLLAANSVRRHPLQHPRYQVRALINVLLRVVFEWKDLPEITAGRVIELVDQVYGMLSDLPADPRKSLFVGKAEESNLFDELRALSLTWEKWSQSHEFSKNATDGPNINFLRII